MNNSKELRTTLIPAGKHAGKYREALNVSYKGSPGTGPLNFKHVVCGTCETKYRAYKTECPSCRGDRR